MAHRLQIQPELAKKTAKITPEIARSALSGDLTAVTSVTNHSFFIIWPYIRKLLGLKSGFLLRKVAPRPQIWPELAKKTLSQNHSQNSILRSVRGSHSCHIGNQPFYFHWMTLTKVTRAEEEIPTSQSGSATTNTYVLSWPKIRPARNTQQKACSALPGDPTAVTSVTNHSISIKRPRVKLLELKRGFLHHKGAPCPQNGP